MKSLSQGRGRSTIFGSLVSRKKRKVWERGEGECRGRKGGRGGRKEERGKRKGGGKLAMNGLTIYFKSTRIK